MGPGDLVSTTAALLVLTILHDLDHVRQGRALGVELYAVAVLALAMLTVTLVALVREHALAAVAAATVGAATVVSVALVHVAPRRRVFSDPYPAAQADLLSWTIIVLMMVGGLALAVGGLRRVTGRATLTRRWPGRT